jgi:hypothetical protein
MRSAKGLFHICDEHAEGAFVPTAAFMRNSPTWRLDVLGDILLDIQRAQQHAAVELFRELSRKNPEEGLERQLQGFRKACGRLGLVLPEKPGGVDRAGPAVHRRPRLTSAKRHRAQTHFEQLFGTNTREPVQRIAPTAPCAAAACKQSIAAANPLAHQVLGRMLWSGASR